MTDEELTLDKKYRPPDFNRMWGNATTIKAITSAVTRAQPFPASIILKGPSGCGKTTIARIIADMLGAKGRDLKQFNIAKMRGIDTARTITDLVTVAPWGACRVIVLNECHRATVDFWNSMLEVLEEPPPNNHFILCTTEPGKVLHTVRTRCTDYAVRLLRADELEPLVQGIAAAEQANTDGSVIREIIKSADGSPRRALVILDAIIDLTTPEEQIEAVRDYRSSEDTVAEVCQALMNKTAYKPVVKMMARMQEKQEAEDVRRGITSYFAKVMKGDGTQAERAHALLGLFLTTTYDNGWIELDYAVRTALVT